MREPRPALLLALSAFLGLLVHAPTQARETVIEWVEVRTEPAALVVERKALATYGPFRVLDWKTAALVDVTDGRSVAAFTAMLRDYPAIATLRFVDCPGTYDDVTNLQLGRLIRAAGLAVEVPAGGSVRSGAVDLMLAGRSLTIADDAEFAVHAWMDEDGHGAAQYSADSPEHRKYLAYYTAMGMADGAAQRFYAMTNSVPYEQARWLTGAEMRRWVDNRAMAPMPLPLPEQPLPGRLPAQPVQLAYLDLAGLLQ